MRLALKYSSGTNALDYFAPPSATKQKRFTTLTSGWLSLTPCSLHHRGGGGRREGKAGHPSWPRQGRGQRYRRPCPQGQECGLKVPGSDDPEQGEFKTRHTHTHAYIYRQTLSLSHTHIHTHAHTHTHIYV